MIAKILNRFKFVLESLMIRGARFQLLFIAFLIVLVSWTAGTIVFLFPSEFKGIGDAVWWAFLRLSDPGYLGDDKGLFLAAVSTVVTVLGYVLFMGALIAIMTQWLQSTMKRLESGLTPISQNNHVLVLGWTNRTPIIVKELMVSEGRVRRFLKRIGASSLHVVILAEEVTSDLAEKLREELGSYWRRRQITFRSGTPLSMDHLRRVDFMNAGVIIIPGADFTSADSGLMDAKTVKTMINISNYAGSQKEKSFPLVVSEMFDAGKIPVARSAYKGDLEIIASDTVIGRLIAQNVRHQGLSYIYTELLTHSEGNEIYIREYPELQGQRIQDLVGIFPKAILLGLLRPEGAALTPILNPSDRIHVQNGDRLVFIARKYMETEPVGRPGEKPVSRGESRAFSDERLKKRLLILGWNQKVASLIMEFESYENERFDIDLLSLMPIDKRQEYLSRYIESLQRVTLRHLQGDYTALSDLRRIRPGEYDNIVLLSSKWMDSGEESDARTLLGYLLLKDMLPQDDRKPEILFELMDPENERLFQQPTGEFLISPVILSHMLAHVALRRDLNVVFEELFTVGGAEIYFRPAGHYDLAREGILFREIEKAVSSHGDTALGLWIKGENKDRRATVEMNPPKDSIYTLKGDDRIVVLSTYL